MTVTRLPTGGSNPPSTDEAPAPDRLFTEAGTESTDFTFDAKTAGVFDDMVSRSVPFYEEIQRMVCEIAADFAEPGTTLYDLGCSTATTLLALDRVVDPSVRFVGVDNSAKMLEKARVKLDAGGVKRPYELVEADLHRFGMAEEASVATLILTLMFIRPLYRQRFLHAIYQGLRPGGCLLMVEKLTMTDSQLNRLFIDYYYRLKRRRHYSEMEISRKRESLENVLIPYRLEENVEMLQTAGFRSVEQFFRWYNFCGIIAVK
ncbi:MAG: carboxy-S-adenosyl-L-methionine synthase CmoA [Alphaproteobacteria bacterium]